jgi:hypothetical protein
MGVRPDIPQDEVSVIPNLPPTWPTLSAANLRIAHASLSGLYDSQRESIHDGSERAVWAANPHRLRFTSKKHLGGSNTPWPGPVSYQIRDTHRGREVIVTTNSGQPLL